MDKQLLQFQKNNPVINELLAFAHQGLKMGATTRAIEALNATNDKEKINPQLLRVLLECGARKSYLLGADCYIKQQNINAAIDTLTRAGFNVSDPSLVGGGQEPIDVEVN